MRGLWLFLENCMIFVQFSKKCRILLLVMRLLRTLLMLALLVPALSAAQQFITQVSTVTLPITGAGVVTTTNFSPGLTKFSPNLGTLTSVLLTFRVQHSATFTGFWSLPSQTANLALSSVDTLALAGQALSLNGNDTRTVFLARDTSVQVNLNIGGSVNREPTSLANFIGSGSLGIASWQRTLSLSRPTGFVNPNLDGTSTARITVRYGYVPEPSSLAALALGLGVAKSRYRRSRTNCDGR